MSLQKQGQVMTTRGPRAIKDLLCYVCGERKPGVFTVNAQGQQVCPDCSSHKSVLDAFEVEVPSDEAEG